MNFALAICTAWRCSPVELQQSSGFSSQRMPVTWDEVKRLVRTKQVGPLNFSPAQALKRLAKVGDLFAPVLTVKQKLPKAFAQLKGGKVSVTETNQDAAESAPEAKPKPALAAYRAKRNFKVTKEPSDRDRTPGKGRGAKARFVIQKHDASHLHYDFRLEMDGTLKSWAVPKGVPTELGVKRSAFAVEDHPLGYMKFEGTIPKGQYGGGTVMVWDIGTYELLGGSYAEGNLKLNLAGKKLKGEWHMFKIRSNDGKDVWLIAKSKVAAKPVSFRQDDSSVLTRRSMARIAKDNDAQWHSNR